MEIEAKIGIGLALAMLVFGVIGYYGDKNIKSDYAKEQCLLQYGTTQFKQPNDIIFCFDEETSKYVALVVE